VSAGSNSKERLLALLLMFLALSSVSKAEKSDYICAIYFTGIGCPHCAKTDPVILGELPFKKGDLVVIEYEIYRDRENANVMLSYHNTFGTPLGIPLIIFDSNDYIIGDTPILNRIEEKLSSMNSNPCLLLDGKVSFEEIDLSSLPGKPKIWANSRVLWRAGQENITTDKKILLRLLLDNLTAVLSEVQYEVASAEPAPLSGSSVDFDSAIIVGDYKLEWRGGPKLESKKMEEVKKEEKEESMLTEQEMRKELTLAKIVSLAAVDAINPCALAVLTLMLVAILTYNPKEKSRVLLAGLAFTISVFSIYFIYGLLIIRFFQLVQALTAIRLTLYKILAIAAIILGLLQIKDVIRYKPGGLLTEMPLSWRPKVKRIIAGVTSPLGAFFVGAFVTVFLLPCTIGPYVIAGGILSVLELIKTIPWLLLYNAIFVLPMLAITLLVYLGIAKVEDVAGWKEKNIRKLHAIAGAIMLSLGIAMLLGLV